MKETLIQPGSDTPKQRKPLWREYLETIAGALFLAVFIMVFVARAFTVDGPSMLPTLHSGERLLIDKVTYRVRPPKRGDVVVFRYPADPKHYFIKRVVGVAGDLVQIEGGKVRVNGVEIDEPYLDAPMLGRNRSFSVPEGHYFVLGDNRNNSQDSRSPMVGYVPRSHIIGRALLRYWPVDRIGFIRSPSVVQASP